jgi:predicted O-linked N-acetylglucosamine transferase (SPINDLY family)
MTISQKFSSAVEQYRAGRLHEAQALCQAILAEQPNHADARQLLAVLSGVAERPDIAGHLIGRGHARLSAGDLPQAQALAREALAADPRSGQAMTLLGVALFMQGKTQEALDLLNQAVAIDPADVQIHLALGGALSALGRYDEAIASLQRAAALAPHLPQVHHELGKLLATRENWVPAIKALRDAAALLPNDAQVLANLGLALLHGGQSEEAIATVRRAAALRPDLAEAHYNLAVMFRHTDQIDEATAAIGRAIELDPGNPEYFNVLAAIQKSQGNIGDAIVIYDRALALKPDAPAIASNRLYAMLFEPAQDLSAIAAAHRAFNLRFAKPLRQTVAYGNNRDPERLLRIGYVSPDFCEHVVGWNLLPLLREHDHNRFHILCYADVARPDEMTEQIRLCADTWRSIRGLSDQQAAELIRADEVDILVDLSVHSAGNRLLIFARKPAPVQVTYLGYCGTTGLEAIDYRLSDPYLDGKEVDGSVYSEQTVRLPRTYWCYEPGGVTPEVGPLPARQTGHITFGSMNNFAKVSRSALELWAQIMAQVAGSRLMLCCPAGSHRKKIIQLFEQRGIAAERVEFVMRRAWRQYIGSYQGIDIGLDSFPWNGGITTCDSLWMGVPVITLAGQTAGGRAGVSLLSNVGLGELIASSPDQYVAIARELAGDLRGLEQMRATLRPRMKASPLMNARQFARDVEGAYRQMWRSWCERETTKQ